LSKKKSVTISKNNIEQNIDDDGKRSTSMSKLGMAQLSGIQNPHRNSGYPLSSFGAKKARESEIKNNFFERKFE
jgi:hypothetical protein